MNRILISVLLALGAGSAFAQSGTVTTVDEKAKADTPAVVQTPAEKSADSYCLHETGSHLRSTTHAKSGKATDCANAAGHAYSREDIERTGAITTGDALRQLDPSVH